MSYVKWKGEYLKVISKRSQKIEHAFDLGYVSDLRNGGSGESASKSSFFLAFSTATVTASWSCCWMYCLRSSASIKGALSSTWLPLPALRNSLVPSRCPSLSSRDKSWKGDLQGEYLCDSFRVSFNGPFIGVSAKAWPRSLTAALTS